MTQEGGDTHADDGRKSQPKPPMAQKNDFRGVYTLLDGGRRRLLVIEADRYYDG